MISYDNDLKIHYSKKISEIEYNNNLLKDKLKTKEILIENNNKQIEKEKILNNEYLLNSKKIDNDFKNQLNKLEIEKLSNEKINDIQIKKIEKEKLINNNQFEENKKN